MLKQLGEGALWFQQPRVRHCRWVQCFRGSYLEVLRVLLVEDLGTDIIAVIGQEGITVSICAGLLLRRRHSGFMVEYYSEQW